MSYLKDQITNLTEDQFAEVTAVWLWVAQETGYEVDHDSVGPFAVGYMFGKGWIA